MYVLLIRKDKLNGGTIEEINGTLKTVFRSKEYMEGFIDGYCFGNSKLLTLIEFEKQLNDETVTADKYIIKFLFINEVEKY